MNSSSPASPRSHRAAAFAISAMILLIMVALYHHPVVAPHLQATEKYQQLLRMETADHLVHGALTVMLAALASVMAAFNRVLDVRRPALSIALCAYCLGCMLLGLAMLLDGFVVPRLALQFSLAPAPALPSAEMILRAVAVSIQVLSKAGLVAQSAAILAWSYASATGRRKLPGQPWLALLGVVAAAIAAAIVLSSELSLTPSSLMLIFAAHSLWYLAVACLLYRCASAPASRRRQVEHGCPGDLR